MKRIIIIFMAFLLMVGAAVGCQPSNPPAEETKAPAEVAKTTSAPEPSDSTTKPAPSESEEAPAPMTAEAFLAKPGIRISVQAGTVGDFVAQDIVGADNVDQFTRYVDAITALSQDKVQGTIMDYGPALKVVQNNPDLVIMDDALTEENYAFGIKKGNDELLDAVNAALKTLSDEDMLQDIFDKYINDEEGAGDNIDFNKGAANGVLIMGTESGFAPYEMRKGDQVIGIDVEIMAAIAKLMDKELVIEDMNFDSLIPAVQSGKIDIIAAGLSVTEARAKEIDFSDDYVVGAKQVLVVKAADLN
ncbi:MAG: transporter substrate-binding domain-containing protein [Clostridiaceae bacterium]|jgi:polar amino acid transport system substrate-binding protein|nr:transporter substrate-binding domain-containing protein [Clostridiaceae bacterium]